MTISIEHSLKFVTEFDETHPVAQQFLALSELDQIQLLEVNEHGTYAILKVAN
jgi:hypothetical protein